MKNCACLAFLNSTVGKKVVVAATGGVLSLFLVGHVLGNLLAFLGAEALIAYATKLHASAPLLWAVRCFLAGTVLVHAFFAFQLWLRNREARPIGYLRKENPRTTIGAGLMAVSGPIIAAFVVFHILHLTTGTVHPSFQAGAEHVYDNLVSGFQGGLFVVAYGIALVALATHLSHGIWSLFQTVGANGPRFDSMLQRVAAFGAVLLTAAFFSVPAAALAGILN